VRRARLSPGSTTLVLVAGAVGRLTAAMLRVTGSKNIVIADIDKRRIDFAVNNEFADREFLVPRKFGSCIEEKLAIARETAAEAVLAADDAEVKGRAGERGGFDAVFECPGVEACLQMVV
jgi:L-iditol 2-dehydrogenase